MINTGLVYYNIYGIRTQTCMTLYFIVSKYHTTHWEYERIVKSIPSDLLLSRCHTSTKPTLILVLQFLNIIMSRVSHVSEDISLIAEYFIYR